MRDIMSVYPLNFYYSIYYKDWKKVRGRYGYQEFGEWVADEGLEQELESKLQALGGKHLEIVRLHYKEGWALDKIATKYDVPFNVIVRMCERAKNAVKLSEHLNKKRDRFTKPVIKEDDVDLMHFDALRDIVAVRVYNLLSRYENSIKGHLTVGELSKMTDEEMLKIPMMTDKAVEDIRKSIAELKSRL